MQPYHSGADNKRVILITGDRTKWYDQAIFIVKKDALPTELPIDFVEEAERIIQNYITNGGSTNPSIGQKAKAEYAVTRDTGPSYTQTAPAKATASKQKKKRTDLIIHLAMLACCAALAGILSYMALR